MKHEDDSEAHRVSSVSLCHFPVLSILSDLHPRSRDVVFDRTDVNEILYLLFLLDLP